MFEALLNVASRALTELSAIPWGVQAALGLAMAGGLVIWLLGQRMLKPLLVTTSVLVGSASGALLASNASWGASLTPWHGAGMGAVAGLVIGLLMYRSATALGFGVVMGSALPLIAATILHFYPLGAGETSSVAIGGGWTRAVEGEWVRVSDAGEQALRGGRALVESRVVDASFDDVERTETALRSFEMSPELQPAADRIARAWSDVSMRVRGGWDELPSAHSAIVGFAGVFGLAGGLILGLMMPRWAASGVTALLGAAIWIPSFVWLSRSMEAPWNGLLDRSTSTWLAIWAITALAGMIVQWSGVLKRSKGASAKPAAAS